MLEERGLVFSRRCSLLKHVEQPEYLWCDRPAVVPQCLGRPAEEVQEATYLRIEGLKSLRPIMG